MGTVYHSSFIALTLHGSYGEQTSMPSTYMQLTMASYENLILTGALRNVPKNQGIGECTQKINRSDFPGFH